MVESRQEPVATKVCSKCRGKMYFDRPMAQFRSEPEGYTCLNCGRFERADGATTTKEVDRVVAMCLGPCEPCARICRFCGVKPVLSHRTDITKARCPDCERILDNMRDSKRRTSVPRDGHLFSSGGKKYRCTICQNLCYADRCNTCRHRRRSVIEAVQVSA